jgi:phycocyanobilin lyase subunit alpha
MPTEENISIDNSHNLTVEQAIVNLQSEDLGLRMYAAWWLGKFRVTDASGVERLIIALEDEDDRTPEGGYPLRRNAARALGKIGNRTAIPHLIAALDCTDFYVREAAAQGLERLGDPICIPKLLELLSCGLNSDRTLVQDFEQPYDAIMECLGRVGATNAVTMIEPFLAHQIDRVRYAAARALYQLTHDSTYGDMLVTALSGSDLQLRRAALSDLGAIGYLPAAEPIANTLAENSLKLIALKGLLLNQINLSPEDRLADGAIQVMKLMDSLL